MKRKYIEPTQVVQSLRKPLIEQTCKDRKSNFLYWELLDDFDQLIRRLAWNTSQDIVKQLASTGRLIEIRLKAETSENEPCLF